MENLEWKQIRCPHGPHELLMQQHVVDNLIELMCKFCTRMKRRNDSAVVRVCHRYNILGELVETVTTRVDTV